MLTGVAFTALPPDRRSLPATVRVTRLVAAARTVIDFVTCVPAMTSPSRKHTVRPERSAPGARTTARFAGRRRHDVTEVAVVAAVFFALIARRKACPLTTRRRGARTVARMSLDLKKVAVTARASLIVTAQGVVGPEQAPDHPVNTEPESAFAASDTDVPGAMSAVQVDPQAMPAGVEVIVPEPAPVRETVRAYALPAYWVASP